MRAGARTLTAATTTDADRRHRLALAPPPPRPLRLLAAPRATDMWYFRRENHIVFPCKRLND